MQRLWYPRSLAIPRFVVVISFIKEVSLYWLRHSIAIPSSLFLFWSFFQNWILQCFILNALIILFYFCFQCIHEKQFFSLKRKKSIPLLLHLHFFCRFPCLIKEVESLIIEHKVSWKFNGTQINYGFSNLSMEFLYIKINSIY